ncbi:hypothetical protein BT67DRAFT_443614 [Trichocladium antarcticum]|uniref:Uncharacterized protein n=1 Tax=Trichocladium antarcticum TaxID=1450529 RepID=A0AAN6UGP6_9PEZI|nr:hypothetical protein BT67DRAFT_443614 [Trichocladium antarcticum]
MKERLTSWFWTTEVPVHEVTEKQATDKKASVTRDVQAISDVLDGERSTGDEISVSAQAGVQDVEALAKVWSKNHHILVCITC